MCDMYSTIMIINGNRILALISLLISAYLMMYTISKNNVTHIVIVF